MKLKEITIDGSDFKLAPLTVEQAESIFDATKDPKLSQRESVLACLNNAVNGSGEKFTMEKLLQIPWYVYRQLCDAVLEVNEISKVSAGEAAAAVRALTSISSAARS